MPTLKHHSRAGNVQWRIPRWKVVLLEWICKVSMSDNLRVLSSLWESRLCSYNWYKQQPSDPSRWLDKQYWILYISLRQRGNGRSISSNPFTLHVTPTWVYSADWSHLIRVYSSITSMSAATNLPIGIRHSQLRYNLQKVISQWTSTNPLTLHSWETMGR